MRFFTPVVFCLLASLALSTAYILSQNECLCPPIKFELCGTDNITYDNLCMLLCASQRALRDGRILTIANFGECNIAEQEYF